MSDSVFMMYGFLRADVPGRSVGMKTNLFVEKSDLNQSFDVQSMLLDY